MKITLKLAFFIFDVTHTVQSGVDLLCVCVCVPPDLSSSIDSIRLNAGGGEVIIFRLYHSVPAPGGGVGERKLHFLHFSVC